MSMRQDPEFYALVDQANAAEAYAATVWALYDPVALERVRMQRNSIGEPKGTDGSSPIHSFEEALASARDGFLQGRIVGRDIPIVNSQGWIITAGTTCDLPKHRVGSHCSLMSVDASPTEVMPLYVALPASHCDLSVPVSAAILGRLGQENMDRIFTGLCAPDAHSRVKMGVYNMLDKLYERFMLGNHGWRAPLEMAATYHGEHLVARDVALSWLYLHDGDLIESVIDLSLDALAARVEAAPAGASVGISSRARHVVKHGLDEAETAPPQVELASPLNSYRGPRERFEHDDNLTREQVLATLQTPSEMLIQALEAAAAPDAEWLEAEKQALDVLAAKKPGEPAEFVKIDELEQRNFLEEHAPFHVRHLPNGGVMLATHPYRYMWPLWSKALDLLGIRSKTT